MTFTDLVFSPDIFTWFLFSLIHLLEVQKWLLIDILQKITFWSEWKNVKDENIFDGIQTHLY